MRKDALLNVACLLLPTLDDDHLEVSVNYSLHQVRRQFELDQGVPFGPSRKSGGNVSNDGRPLALVLVGRERELMTSQKVIRTATLLCSVNSMPLTTIDFLPQWLVMPTQRRKRKLFH